jgi:hypothetical protein
MMMRYRNYPNKYWRVGLSLLLISFVSFVTLSGCSKTDKGESSKKSEAPAVAKPQVDDGKPFSFRGITMGTPLKTQFKDCKSQPGVPCYKEGVKGEPFKEYQIEGLPKLDFGTMEYAVLLDGNVELILVEFVKEYASTNMMKLLKGQYGEPASYNSSMLAEKATDLPYEKFLATWNVKGCVLELSNVRDNIVDRGRVLIKSEKYLKRDAQGSSKK